MSSGSHSFFGVVCLVLLDFGAGPLKVGPMNILGLKAEPC